MVLNKLQKEDMCLQNKTKKQEDRESSFLLQLGTALKLTQIFYSCL